MMGSRSISVSCLFWGHIKKCHVYSGQKTFSQCHRFLLYRNMLYFNSTTAFKHRQFTTAVSDSPTILQPVSKSSSTTLRIKKISKAMKAYLERAKSHEEFMSGKSEEYEIGKHHLANMMGVEVGAMTEEDIDRAIQYLLPSGLYEPKARPMMKPPEKMFPKEKAAQFDDSGRPFNPFFYARKANLYQTMHEILIKFQELDALEDKMLRKGINSVPKETVIDLSGGEWLTIDAVRNIFLEYITDEEFNFFINTVTRLAQHSYSFRCKDFIWKFRKDFPDISKLHIVPELQYDENERPYIEATGFKNKANATVKVLGNGTGKISINGKDICYFKDLQEREQVMFPLEYSGMLGKVDVEATVAGSGLTSQASAIRFATAMCLRSFVSEEYREKIRLAGLLTADKRRKERKKPGQKGARAKFKWLKR